ncbi:MAG: aminotransferase class I/II-fold pyridoxal phosphate-dependent enzyme, partial [Candidatus Wallbacteria bacterium]|nr:aminotransferase class I/II-fold pyridoxal phosphate-dependent enzyme [Candidatus Wallbacteria bacterium]
PIASDKDGLRIDTLAKELKRHRPSLLYLMPNFQNPTGVSLSMERRRRLVEIVRAYDLPVVEDDPYGELVFSGEKPPSLLELGGMGNFIYMSSFSKTIAPGLRVAYLAGDEEIIRKLTLVKQGTASRGRSFTVTIPVRNLGQATARVTAATLVWSRSSVTSALKPGQLLDIPPNTTGTAVAMTVTVASNTPLGAVTSVATVDAIDVNSGSRLPRISFQSSSPTTIQVPAVLSIQSLKGQSKVSQGQSFVVTVGVKDLGVAAARIRNATLVWSPPSVVSVLASPATPTFVNGGSNVTTTTLSFACTVDSAATIGQTAADLAVTANDANDDTFDISVLTTHIGTTLVQTKATPVLASLNSPAFITQGQSIRVALTVNNIGQAKLLLDPPALTLTVAAPRLTASVRPTNPTSIAGNSSAQLFFDLAASATATPGTTNIGAALVGHDENVPGPTINSTNPNIRQITIQRPPQLSLGSLVSVPPHVSQGQQLLLALLVSNPPDAAAATFNGPSLLGSAAGISTVTTPPSPSTVASGQTTNLVFLATVAGTATTGTIFLQGVVPFLDANTLSPTSLSPVIRNPVGQLDVQVGAKLSLGQTGARTAVTQGQGFSATISATNLSGAAGAAATGTVASFQRSDTSFSATLTPPLGTINGAATVNSTLTISTANPGTSVGSKNVVVTFSAHDGNSGQVTQDTVKSITVSFVVQGRPTLLAQSPSVPTSMSQGEIKVPIAVSFSNQTASGAPARITGLSLTFLNGSTDDSIHYTPTFATPLPARVGAGGSLSVPLLVDVSPAAITGTVTVSANILAVDDNDGTSLTVTSPAGSTTTVVGARPVLRIAGPTNALPGIFPAKSKLSTGQAVQFQLQVRNFGAASANITGGGLSFFSGFVNKTGEYSVGLSSGAGTIAASNLGNPTAATLTFNVTPSTGASGFGTISVGGTVTATASVGGANATTSITPPVTGGTFVLQSAVILSSGDIFFDPILPTGVDRASGTTSGDLAFSRVTVRLRVNNANGPSGASLVISAASLNLTTNIASVNADYDIVPPASLPVTVSGNGTAFLSFGLAAKPQAQKAVLVTIQPSITFSDANVGGSSSLTGGSQGWFVRDRASAVFGQTDFSSATATPAAANRFNSPLAAASDGSRLFVADTNNSRVLIYPSLSATSPSTCIGQANFLGGTVNGGLPVGPTTLSIPSGIAVTGTKLIVVDSGNNRALVFNDYRSLPQFGAAADIVVGQADFSGSAANRNAAVGADGMSNPRGAVVIASVLFIADTANNRVLRFDQVPSTNNPTASAAVVIGQPNVTSSNLNQGAAVPGPNTLALPAGLGTDGQRLFIADQGNDRVLVYATSLSANNANADRVLGHTNFVSGTSSKPTTDGGLSRPTGVAAAGDKVYVADTGNNRVVQFFNPNPANFANFINGERALDLLGQARFTENGANNTVSGSRDAFSLSGPGSVVTTSITDATHAIVVDTGNNRVLLVPVP